MMNFPNDSLFSEHVPVINKDKTVVQGFSGEL